MVRVKNIMRVGVITVNPEDSVSRVAKIMANNRVGSAVVLKGKKPVGIITREDIVHVVAHGKNPNTVKVKDFKQKIFLVAKPHDDLLSIIRQMTETGVKRAPVVDKGKLVGIITDKEILLAAPELIDLLKEKLKSRAQQVAEPGEVISGLCERCGDFSEDLRHTDGRWYCEDCRNDEGIEEDDEANL
ncbi:MAG TPA: CBS domain-containing protein [archaeon]|nr:CBS domain-containing protein [archaeon]